MACPFLFIYFDEHSKQFKKKSIRNNSIAKCRNSIYREESYLM